MTTATLSDGHEQNLYRFAVGLLLADARLWGSDCDCDSHLFFIVQRPLISFLVNGDIEALLRGRAA